MLSRYAQPSEQQQQEGYLGVSNFHDNTNAYPAQEEFYPRRPTPYADHDSIVKPEVYHHSQPSNNSAHSHHPTPSAPIAVDTQVYRQFSEFGSSHTSSTVSPEQTSAWLPDTSSNPYNSFGSHTPGMSYTAIPGHNQQMYRQPLAYQCNAPFNFATSSSNDNIYQTAIYGFSGSSSNTDATAFTSMTGHGLLGMDDGFNRNAAQLNQGYHSSKNIYANDSGVISTDVLSHANSSQHSDHAPRTLYEPCSPVHSLSATATPPPPAMQNDYQDGASIGRSSSLRASSSSSYTAEPQRGKRNSDWPTDRVPYKLRRSSDPTSTAADTKAQQPDSKNRRKATWLTSSLDPTFGPNVSIEKKMQEVEQLEHYDLQLKSGSSGIDKKEKRRVQNRLAQRAFRARSKVHGKETVSHVASLEHLAETQLDRLTKMTAVVYQPRKENTSLQLAQSPDDGVLDSPQTAGSTGGDQHFKTEVYR